MFLSVVHNAVNWRPLTEKHTCLKH